MKKLITKTYMMFQDWKEKVAERLMARTQSSLQSQKGGIENYITMLVIIAIVLIIGWAIWRWMGTGEDNVINRWFQNNIGHVIDCTGDSITGGTSGTQDC